MYQQWTLVGIQSSHHKLDISNYTKTVSHVDCLKVHKIFLNFEPICFLLSVNIDIHSSN